MTQINELCLSVNKLSSLVTNQKNCTDSFVSTTDALKDKATEIQHVLKDDYLTTEEREVALSFLKRLMLTLKDASGLHKQYLFAFDYLGISRIEGGLYEYNGASFKAPSLLKALERTLDTKGVSDKEAYILQINSISRHGLSMGEIIQMTKLKKGVLESMALHNPWQFNIILNGCKQRKLTKE